MCYFIKSFDIKLSIIVDRSDVVFFLLLRAEITILYIPRLARPPPPGNLANINITDSSAEKKHKHHSIKHQFCNIFQH